MAKFHMLDRVGPGAYNAVAHFLIPAGNNSVGVSWKTCYLGSFGAGAPASVLPSSGNNNETPGKITSSELTSIAAGNTVEVPFLYSEDTTVNMSTAERQANIDVMADRAINEFKVLFADRFKFYGY